MTEQKGLYLGACFIIFGIILVCIGDAMGVMGIGIAIQ